MEIQQTDRPEVVKLRGLILLYIKERNTSLHKFVYKDLAEQAGIRQSRIYAFTKGAYMLNFDDACAVMRIVDPRHTCLHP